jgi:enoyl-CoA hydratase
MSVTHRLVGRTMEIRMVRPEKRNAIDRQMAEGLDRALAAFESSPAARAAVLLGEGPAFCAGTDMADPSDKRTAVGGEYGLLRRERSKPLIAAVDGPALGGGFEIVLACDLIVASDRAEFGLPETQRGLVATGGGLFRASQSLPYHVAAELLLTGRRLSAHRAHQLGLVSSVVAPGAVLAAAHALADAVATAGPTATAETLVALRGLRAKDDHLGWWATARAKGVISTHPEAMEGRQAFLEGRPPRWIDDQARGDER